MEIKRIGLSGLERLVGNPQGLFMNDGPIQSIQMLKPLEVLIFFKIDNRTRVGLLGVDVVF